MSSRVFVCTCRSWHTAGTGVQNASLRLMRPYLCFNMKVTELPCAVWKAVLLQLSFFQVKGAEVHYLRPVIPFAEVIQASMPPWHGFKI